MKLMVLAGFATLAFASNANAAIQNLVVNGDFTQLSNGPGSFNNSTAVTGWTSGGYNWVDHDANSGDSGTSMPLWTQANNGNNTWNGTTLSGTGNFAAMDGDYFTGPISQTINGLIVGKQYTLTFNYAFGQQTGFDGATVQSLDAAIGGTTWNSGDVDLPNHGFSGWATESLDFIATDKSETLSFLAHGNLPVPPFALVSDVVIPAVPEMQVWAMMILGLGAVGLTMRRRQAATMAAA